MGVEYQICAKATNYTLPGQIDPRIDLVKTDGGVCIPPGDDASKTSMPVAIAYETSSIVQASTCAKSCAIKKCPKKYLGIR